MKAVGSVLGAFVLIVIGGIAASVLVVWIYSTFINSGQAMSVYQAFAEQSAPIVSVIVGPLVTYGVIRLFVRKLQYELAKKHAVMVMALYAVFDIAVVAVNQPTAAIWGIAALSLTLRAIAAWLAVRVGPSRPIE